MEDKKLKAALWYLKQGFSVIPTNGKIALIPWQQYQKEKPTADQIKQWWGKEFKFANIGIVTGSISGITVIDVDTRSGKQLLEEVLPESWLTPTVDTPGHGEHFYCKYEEGIGNSVRFMEGCDIRSEGGYVVAPPSSDARGAWSWREGCKITDLEIASIPDAVLSKIRASIKWGSGGVIGGDGNKEGRKLSNYLHGQHDSVVNDPQRTTKTTNDNILNFNEGSRDDSLFHVANCLVKGGMPIQEIEYLLSLIALNLCSPPFPMKEIEAKIKSALQRSERKQRSLTEEIREFVGQHSGNITTTLCQQGLQMTTREDQKKIWIVLNRLAKEGLLEKTGRVAGEYRIVEKQYEVVEASDIQIKKGIDLTLPFFLENHVEILPKDLIVIAGTPNSGKTALLLDMVAKNQNRWDCWYFSTEMGQQACARRLAMRDPHIEWKFKFVQDFGAYEDVIKPDALNFIDYVEQNEGEAFKIPGILAKIQRKLKNGVAVVALQKNQGKGWAIGGEQTRAKPTLFLTIEQQYPGQILKIEKAKAFKDYNPNGFCIKFKIVKGINLIPQNDWGPELA